MGTPLETAVRWLKIYAALATLCCLTMLFLQFGRRPRFAEIDVERINVIEKDGTLRMVISNQERQHPGIVHGKLIERDGPRPPGLLFFNPLGDEMGGLIFGENGRIGHFGSLTFDKVRNDQTIGFRHLEGDDGRYEVGLTMWQQPNLPGDEVRANYEAAVGGADEEARATALQAMRDRDELTTTRLFLGKLRDDTSQLELSDRKGRPRLRLAVTADGASSLEFLDENGTVLQRFAGEGGAKDGR